MPPYRTPRARLTLLVPFIGPSFPLCDPECGETRLRCAGVASHPRFEIAVVADEPDLPDWAHERNEQLADAFGVPYVRDIDRALRDYNIQVAIVSPEGERHCSLSIQAARAGKHIIQDKPLATRRG
jgi:predicted dehydrogenase